MLQSNSVRSLDFAIGKSYRLKTMFNPLGYSVYRKDQSCMQPVNCRYRRLSSEPIQF